MGSVYLLWENSFDPADILLLHLPVAYLLLHLSRFLGTPSE